MHFSITQIRIAAATILLAALPLTSARAETVQ